MDLTLKSATVPPPLNCVINNANWQALVGLLAAIFPDECTLFNFGPDTPDPSKRNRPWIRQNADGTDDGTWVFAQGFWTKKHPLPEGSIIILPTGLVVADIPTFDDGEAGAIGLLTGPMWSEVTELQARMPLGAGTLPSATVVAPGATGGEENHTLAEKEIPKHSHYLFTDELKNPLKAPTAISKIAKQCNFDGLGAPNSYYMSAALSDTTEATIGQTSAVGGDATLNPVATAPHNNLSPYFGVIFIQRTARGFYRLPG